MSLWTTSGRSARVAEASIESGDGALGRRGRAASGALFEDREHAGALLAELLVEEAGPRTVVFGVDRGGVPIAAAVAQRLGAPLDAIAIARVAHPHRPGAQLGARTAEGPPAIDPRRGGLSPTVRAALDARLTDAAQDARELDAGLHRLAPPIDPAGAVCVLVTDAIAVGTPAIAAHRWALRRRASRTVVAAPLASALAAEQIRAECGAVRALHVREHLTGLTVWHRDRARLSTAALAEVIRDQRGGGSRPEADSVSWPNGR